MSTAPVAPDSYATPTDTYGYDAFGNLIGSTGTTPNVYRYQGEALDEETGLYYFRARYYDPVAGRFLTVDPLASEGEHPYEYAAADPVNGHDPTGEQDVLEYTSLLWLFYAYVPPPPDRLSCLGGISFSGRAPDLMTRILVCQLSRPQPGRPGQPGKPDTRRPTYLLVTGDCYYKATAYVRRREYEVLDEKFQKMGNGIEVRESVTNIKPASNKISAGGVWSTGADDDPGAFYDYYTNGYNPSPTNACQQYFSQGRLLQVLEPDNLSNNPQTYTRYGTQGVYYEYDGVKIDGYYKNPVLGSKKPCEPPTPYF